MLIDSKGRYAKVKVLLKGKSEPIEGVVDGYEMTKEAGKSFIRIIKVSSDRL